MFYPISKVIVSMGRDWVRTVFSWFIVAGLLVWLTVFPFESVLSSGPILPPSGLVSWWAADGNALDIWDGNDGTLMNGAGFASGKVAQAFSLDGVDDYVLVPDSPSLDITEAITIDAWIKAPPVVGDDGAEIVDKGDWAYVGGACSLRISADYSGDLANAGPNLLGRANFLVWIGDPSSYPDDSWHIDSQTRVDDDAWHFLAATYDGTAMDLYVDGALETTFSVSGSMRTTDFDLMLGCNSPIGGRHFCGLIDEVEIFNRSLSAGEIQALYDAGSFGKVKEPAVGGLVVPIDKIGLLAPCAIFASAFIVATAAAVVRARRHKRRRLCSLR